MTIFSDPISRAIVKFESHPSIIKIKTMFGDSNVFEFGETNTDTVRKLVMSLDSSKVTAGNINSKMLKLSSNICSPSLTLCINSMINNAKFPDALKRAVVSPIFKKGDPNIVKNYRPISLLPTASKLFEKILAAQLSAFFESHRFSKLLCGFRKGYSSQQALLRLIQKWQENLDQSNIVGDCIHGPV